MPSLVRTHSTDSGFTWSLPQETGVRGDFPNLIVLPDDRLLLTCSQRRTDGAALFAAFSEDGGVTWLDGEPVRSAVDAQFRYPSAAVLPDGVLLAVCMSTPPDGVRVVEVVRRRPD